MADKERTDFDAAMREAVRLRLVQCHACWHDGVRPVVYVPAGTRCPHGHDVATMSDEEFAKIAGLARAFALMFGVPEPRP